MPLTGLFTSKEVVRKAQAPVKKEEPKVPEVPSMATVLKSTGNAHMDGAGQYASKDHAAHLIVAEQLHRSASMAPDASAEDKAISAHKMRAAISEREQLIRDDAAKYLGAADVSSTPTDAGYDVTFNGSKVGSVTPGTDDRGAYFTGWLQADGLPQYGDVTKSPTLEGATGAVAKAYADSSMANVHEAHRVMTHARHFGAKS